MVLKKSKLLDNNQWHLNSVVLSDRSNSLLDIVHFSKCEFIYSTQNGEAIKSNNTAAAAAATTPFLMPGHPFPLAAAAAAAAAAGIPVSLPNPTSAVKDKPDLPLPGYPFPFFRPPNR